MHVCVFVGGNVHYLNNAFKQNIAARIRLSVQRPEHHWKTVEAHHVQQQQEQIPEFSSRTNFDECLPGFFTGPTRWG